MSERDLMQIAPVKEFVEAVSKLPNVNRLAQVRSSKGKQVLYTLTPDLHDDTGRCMHQGDVVRSWAPIVEDFADQLALHDVEAGAVFCEGQFKDYIEGSGSPREFKVLFDASA